MPPTFAFDDHRVDRVRQAATLRVSQEALDLHYACDVIDLHIDSYIWTRIIGYDLLRRHGLGLLRGRWFHQVDLPRALDAGVTGAQWVVTTNFLANGDERVDALVTNLAHLRHILESSGHARVVSRAVEYAAARAAGLHGAFLAIQGGNAIARAPHDVERLVAADVVRVTLVHLTSSAFGTTSSPLAGGVDGGLTDRGHDLVAALDERRIFVDLAHASRRTFWDAVAAHDRSLPLIATHTGVCGVKRHWRNLDDDQLRAIAATGGTVGVMLQSRFLGVPRAVTAATVVDHLAHIVATVGEDHASIGTDFDGWIRPPLDLPSCLELPRLTQAMLDRGWQAERIQKILGGNFLRALAALRG